MAGRTGASMVNIASSAAYLGGGFMALGDPVIVTYRQDNGTLVALSATDANP